MRAPTSPILVESPLTPALTSVLVSPSNERQHKPFLSTHAFGLFIVGDTMHARKKKPCFLRRRRAKAAVDNAIALLLPALGLLSGVAEQLNVPGLKAGVEGLASLLEMVKVSSHPTRHKYSASHRTC